MEQKDILGVALAAISEEHIFTFMLSSPFTARTIVAEKGQVEDVKQDLNIALGLSVSFAVLLGYFLGSSKTAILGTAFGIVFWQLYRTRGNLE